MIIHNVVGKNFNFKLESILQLSSFTTLNRQILMLPI